MTFRIYIAWLALNWADRSSLLIATVLTTLLCVNLWPNHMLVIGLILLLSIAIQSTFAMGMIRARNQALNTLFVIALQELVIARMSSGKDALPPELAGKVRTFVDGPKTKQ